MIGSVRRVGHPFSYIFHFSNNMTFVSDLHGFQLNNYFDTDVPLISKEEKRELI